jgi:hypothetical protein
MRRIVGFGSVLLLVAFSVVICSSATASALIGRKISSFAVHPTSVNFGNTPDDTTASIPVVVTIDSGYEYSDPDMLAEWGDSSPASGGCDGFIGPGTCIEDLTFSPSATGAQTNVFELDEVPANGAPGAEESLYVDESGDGVSCSSVDTSYLLTAYTTDGTFNGVFCLNSAGTGTYTQGAFDGAHSVSGAALVDFGGGTVTPVGLGTTAVGSPAAPATPSGGTTLYAQGPDLLLAGSNNAEDTVTPSVAGGVSEVTNGPIEPFEPVQPIGSASRFEEDAPLNTSGSFTLSANMYCLDCVPG